MICCITLHQIYDFTNGNFNGGNSAAYMFNGAVSLQCMYPIDKLTTVKNIDYLYNRNRFLPYLEIHSCFISTIINSICTINLYVKLTLV